MNHNNQEDDIITQLFQSQRKEERRLGPSFSEIYGKVKRKYIKMKRIKWLTIAIILASLILMGIYSINNYTNLKQNIPVLQANTSLYDRLLSDGKIVTNDIQFDFNKATLRPESMRIIQSIAEMMQQHPEIRLSIEGHTDNTGSASYNLELSSMRAAAVKLALQELSIEEGRLISRGFGASKPIFDNSTTQGRAKNRRVEFVLLK